MPLGVLEAHEVLRGAGPLAVIARPRLVGAEAICGRSWSKARGSGRAEQCHRFNRATGKNDRIVTLPLVARNDGVPRPDVCTMI